MATERSPFNLKDTTRINLDNIINIPQRKSHLKYTGIRSKTNGVNGRRFHARITGFICVCICIVSWISMAEIEPLLFAHSFHKPYFLNYIATCSLMVMIIPYLIANTLDKLRQKLKANKRKRIINHNLRNKYMNYNSINSPTNTPQAAAVPSIHSQYKQLLIPSITVSLLYFTNNYLWFMSLYYTIAAVNNTIYQSQCIFVLLLSVVILKKKLTKYNLMSVISSIIGVGLISFLGREHEDNSSVHPSMIGVIFCISAAFMYALFQVKMNAIEQKYFDQTNNYNKFKSMCFFQFMMGLNIFLLTWPGFFFLNYFGVESFVFPLSGNEWLSIMILSFFTILYCITYIIGICFSGALFMSIGTLLVIPFTYMVDIWLYQLIITPVSIIGSCFVIIGFILMQKNSDEMDINHSEKVQDAENEEVTEYIHVTKEHKDEILSYLPADIDGAAIVEIESGSGEFTEYLASKATSILVVNQFEDNREKLMDKYPHIDYLYRRNVMQLDLDRESYDFVFSRYNMKHLNSEEMHQLALKYCQWVAYDGYIFVCVMNEDGEFTKILDGMHDLEWISMHKAKTNEYYFLYKKHYI